MKMSAKKNENPYAAIQVEKLAKEHLQRQLVGVDKVTLGIWVRNQIYSKFPKKIN